MGHKADNAPAGGTTRLTQCLHANANTFLYAIAWIITLAAAFAGFEPLVLVVLMATFVLLTALYLTGAGELTRSFSQRGPLFLTLLAFAAYIVLSALWSANPLLALEKGFLIILLVLGISFTSQFIKQMSALQLHRCARGILVGLLVGMAFAVFEYATNNLILNAVAKQFPELVKTIEETKLVPPYRLNANVTVMMLFLWPALLIALAQREKYLKNWYLIALAIASVFLLYKTQSATAQLAFAFAAPICLAAYFAPRYINLIARILWGIAVIGVVPIVMALHFAGLQNMKSLPYSFRDRIHIWNYTARLVPQNPVLGIGIRTNRSYKIEPREVPRIGVKKLVDRQGWHSHNIFLQTWYELGAFGAAFLLAIGLLLLSVINKISAQMRPFAYAVFASFSVVAAFGFGLWQSWLLAAYGWSVIFLLIGLRYGDDKAIDQPSALVPEPE